jgi:hypothetical protein
LSTIEIKDLALSTKWRKTKKSFRLHLFDLRDGTPLSLPAAIIAGRKNSPKIAILAGQHGDEWNGTYIVHQLFGNLEWAGLQGMVILLPILNPLAYLEESRVSQLDQVDMNRIHASSCDLQPTASIAQLLFDRILRDCQFVLDIHTGSSGSFLPNVGVVRQGYLPLALSLNLDYVVLLEPELGSLVSACERQGIPAFSIEIGGSRSIDFEQSDKLVKGILNFLRHQGVLMGKEKTNPKQQLFTGKQPLSAEVSGFFEASVALGQTVEKDQILGVVTPILSSKGKLRRSPVSGKIIYLAQEKIVGSREILAQIAYSDSKR